MKYIFINNKFIAEKNALISIKERACRFGDGIFETCKIANGIIYNYEAHQARIIRGLKALEISANIKNLKEDSYKLIAKNKIKNGVLRISISRGIGSIGYLPTNESTALIIIEAFEVTINLPKKITVGISKIKAPKRSAILQKCKTMQGLNYILAKIAAKKSGYFDDVMLSEEGFISECSSANIFWIKNNKIFTPSTKCDMLFGNIRQKIINKYPQKINLVEARVSRLAKADEVFITNANLLILPVDELIIGNKKISLQKTLSNHILRLVQQDVKNYISSQCHHKK